MRTTLSTACRLTNQRKVIIGTLSERTAAGNRRCNLRVKHSFILWLFLNERDVIASPSSSKGATTDPYQCPWKVDEAKLLTAQFVSILSLYITKVLLFHCSIRLASSLGPNRRSLDDCWLITIGEANPSVGRCKMWGRDQSADLLTGRLRYHEWQGQSFLLSFDSCKSLFLLWLDLHLFKVRLNEASRPWRKET